jgi:Aspartyl protease
MRVNSKAFATRGGHRSPLLGFAMLSVLFASPSAFASGCKLGKIAEFPITMVDLRPLMTAGINGVDVRFIVDSGAFYSMISAAAATELKLKTTPTPIGFNVYLYQCLANDDLDTADAVAPKGADERSMRMSRKVAGSFFCEWATMTDRSPTTMRR